jgi:hypothetical protein
MNVCCTLTNFSQYLIHIAGFVKETNGEKEAEVSEKLGEIVLELKKRVPPLSVFPTEKFFVPVDGEVLSLSGVRKSKN